MGAIRFLFDGRIGVVIFFVLSGLVLGNSLRRSGALSLQTYLQFCFRRVFRIFPAYFISTFFYLFLYLELKSHPVSQAGFLGYYESASFSSVVLAENFFFCHQGLNGVTWTLKVEMMAAFLLPFMHYFSSKVGWRGRTFLLLGLILLGFLPSSRPTRMCLYFFYCGYLLSPLIEHPATEDVSGHKFKIWGLFVLALISFALGHLFPMDEGGRRFTMLGAAVGSVLILLLLIRAPDLAPFRFLDQLWIRHLGKISYSFYLYNLLCIDLVEQYGPWPDASTRAWDTIEILVTAVLLCAAVATLSYFLIERPFIKWGAKWFEAFRARMFVPRISLPDLSVGNG